jgi:hypothetical protein
VAPGRKLGNDDLGFGRGFEVAAFVREANDAVGVGDIDPLRIVGGMEGDAVGLVQSVGKDGVLRRLRAALFKTVDRHLIGAGFGDEYVAIRGHAHDTRPAEAGSDHVCGKALWQLGADIFRRADPPRAVGGGLCRKGSGKVLRREMPSNARPVVPPAAERRFAGQRRAGFLRHRGSTRQQDRSRRDPFHEVDHAVLLPLSTRQAAL